MAQAATVTTSATPTPAGLPGPPRQVRPLAPSQIGLAEYATRHFVVTLPIGTEFEDCLRPEFWSNVTQQLTVSSKIDVFDAGMTIYAELLVRHVVQARPVAGTKGGAQIVILRYLEFDAIEKTQLPPAEHEIRYLGTADRWGVVRTRDGQPVVRHLESREAAMQHLAAMATAPA